MQKKPIQQKLKYYINAAIIAAIYALLSIAFAPISFGPIQIRIAEALCVLIFFTSAAIPGLFIGCIIANAIGVYMGVTILLDLFIGPMATLIASLLGYYFRHNKFLLILPTVIINGLFVGMELHYFLTPAIPLILCILYVSGGQIISAYGLGLPLLFTLKKSEIVKKLLKK